MTSIINFIDSFFESILSVMGGDDKVALFTFIIGAIVAIVAEEIYANKKEHWPAIDAFCFFLAAIIVVAYKVYWLFYPEI